MPLVTRNVFIDTEFLMKAELDFTSGTIKSFEELCSTSELVHITNTVVVQEVRKKILEIVKEGLKGLGNFEKRTGFLRNNVELIDEVFPHISEERLKEQGYKAYQDFLDSTSARIIDVSGVDGNEIIDMFFKQKRPFGAAKKQNEFRDAFSLLAIRSALKNQEKIYVVSADSDHKAFCQGNNQFVSVDTLSALLDMYYRHNNERAAFVEKFLIDKKEDIKNRIKEILGEAEGYNSSTWEDSEIDGFDVLEVEDFEPEIIQLDDESCQITFDVEVKFSVSASGPDYVNGHYDREDDVIYTHDTATRQEEVGKEFFVELDLSFEADEDEFINDEFDLHIKGLNGAIEFYVEETPYEDPRL